MRLILLSVLVAIASATPALLGSNKCTYGPSYWCSHVKHARECGAMKHCMTAVWNFNTVPVKSDAECEVCVFGVTEARKLLKDKATQEEIADFLEKGCQLVPDAKLKSECENVVKNYLPEILQLLASDVDPKAICAAIGMCTAELSQPEAATTTTKAPGDVCADCEKLLKDLEDTLKDNKTLAQMEASLDQMLCASLGPLEAECKQLVAQYLPAIFEMIFSEFNPGVTCRMLGLCSTSNVKDSIQFRVKLLGLVKQLPMSNKVDGPEECSLCKMVMAELQSLDRDAKTQQTVESFLEENFCGLLGEMKAQCQELIKDYAPMIFEYLANELDPEVACKAFHLCTQSQKPHHKLTAVSLVNSALSVRKLDLEPVKPQTNKPQPQSQPKPVKSSATCVLCEFVLKEIDSLLEQNASRSEVTQALEAVCARLPDTIAAECKNFVDQYAAAVIELLVADLDPAKVCQVIGLCSRAVLFAVPKVSEGTCEICELLIQYLDSMLKENATEAEIVELLEKICNFLPDTLKQQCDNIVEQYGPMIAQLLAQFADPLKVCQGIGLCTSSTIAHQSLNQMNSLIKQAKEDNSLYYHQAGQAAGRLNCLVGPSVWCKDAATANKCGVHAVNYCRLHVWV